MKSLRMSEFAKKYDLKTYTLSRRISEYQTVQDECCVKLRILDNAFNKKVAMRHRNQPANRPRLATMPIDLFLKNYGVSDQAFQRRYRSIEKVEIDGQLYVKLTRANLRHCGVLQ